MEKVDSSILKLPFAKVDFTDREAGLVRGFQNIHIKVNDLLIKQGYLLVFIGFLLGRALILAQLTPFTLPFFAAVFLKYRQRVPLVAISLVGGAATLSIGHALYTTSIIIIFFAVHYVAKSFVKYEWKVMPYYIFTITLLGKLLFSYITVDEVTVFVTVMAFVEAVLAYIFSFIFLQSLSFLTVEMRYQSLKTEEIVSVIIMLASVLTGTIGWQLYGLSIDHIMSRYLVLIFSFVAGATVGSTVGVVTGLVFSLANVASFFQMSLLAFSGLLGGLLKEGKKVGVAAGLVVATLLIGMYGESNSSLSQTMLESSIAIILLIITPKSLTTKLAKNIPGTQEYQNEQQLYMRKVRDVTAQRVANFSNVFQALSNSFAQFDSLNEEDDYEREIDLFLSNVTEKTCQTCHRKQHCWTKNFSTTYNLMAEVMEQLERDDSKLRPHLARRWHSHCIRANKVIDETRQQLTFLQANKKLKRQVQESRRLVAEQLLGVSEVMDDFATEIIKEREAHHLQEEQIYEMLKQLRVNVEQVEIYSLERGNIDIDMTVQFCQDYGECDKLIAPMLSNILEETIIANKSDCQQFDNGLCYVTFQSAKKYVVTTGVAHAAQGGGLISGDSYATVQLGGGKYAVAISDGMGNGERAFKESRETLQLLEKILQSGIEEKIAIKSINSILSLRTTDEIFSTLDLALIDLQDANVKFLKISSIPSFIKRASKVMKVEASNLPIGIFQDVDIEVVNEQFKAGDILIMMSDGVFEGPNLIENNDLWIKRKIRQLETDDPQEIADLLIEEVIRARKGDIKDDMTVLVARIDHNIPKWAPIPLQSIRKKVSS